MTTERTVPRFDAPPDEHKDIALLVEIPRYLRMRGPVDIDALAEALGRLCEASLPLLLTGTPEHDVLRRITRNYPYRPDSGTWPPPEPQP